MGNAIVLSFVIGLAGCGGGGGEPLISGSLAGSYAGTAFTPDTGFASMLGETTLVAVGDGGLDCGSTQQQDPPSGINALIAVPLAVGSYANVLVELYYNIGEFEGIGSNTGSVTITAASETSVAGDVSYSYTDDEQRMFSLAGTFEVIRCQ